MKQRINILDYLSKDGLKAIPVGETYNFYHCRTGHNNDRFHVTRTKHNLWLGHCKHCGESGHFFDRSGDTDYESLQNEIVNKINDYINVAPDLENLNKLCMEDIEFDAHSHNSSYFIPKIIDDKIANNAKLIEVIVASGINWDVNKIVFPIGTESNKYHNGVSIRWIFGEYNGPKYITNSLGPNCYVNKGRSDSPCKDTLFITEDMLSATVLSYFYGAKSIWLGGTTLHPEQLQSIVHSNPSGIFIWLDDDNPQVCKNNLSIRDELQCLYGGYIPVVSSVDEYSARRRLPKSGKDIFRADGGWGDEFIPERGISRLSKVEEFLSNAHS